MDIDFLMDFCALDINNVDSKKISCCNYADDMKCVKRALESSDYETVRCYAAYNEQCLELALTLCIECKSYSIARRLMVDFKISKEARVRLVNSAIDAKDAEFLILCKHLFLPYY